MRLPIALEVDVADVHDLDSETFSVLGTDDSLTVIVVRTTHSWDIGINNINSEDFVHVFGVPPNHDLLIRAASDS